jgi:glyoxylase-like metal-dependent hydrolase (beta-lactamase superfamily II)
VTHGHGDHLGDAMEFAKTNDVPMWAPAGLNQTLLTLGHAGQAGAAHEQRRHDRAFPGAMVRAEHSSEMILKDPATAARRLDDARKTCKARS